MNLNGVPDVLVTRENLLLLPLNTTVHVYADIYKFNWVCTIVYKSKISQKLLILAGGNVTV